MNKTARTLFTLLLAVCLLPACTRKQAPSQYGNEMGGGKGGSLSDTGDYGGDYVPEGSFDMSLDGSAIDGLTERGSDGIENGMYKGFTMVEGVLPSIYFDFDSSSVAASERSKLQQAADYLDQNSGYHILVEGHCDWYGTSEYNLALGDRRANSVSDYLGTLGITPLRVEKLSKGSLEATSGLSKSQSSQDRRADLILLKK
ncbi:OmpA family protein [Coraliomargarita algicola]|uniref:OmpA family protein n=1 Tax=Coraliomargarita algicola TaxID=3092156 RepID=A0ABZ0RSX2_9BACT|nr:OmpA family protein [Coraliomargarita sp. J2-16]WPJ98181.1 OmpA family protein [Coraliomargarita sp. J2-16]